ncbi:YadA family autotransporter adhesin [Paraburkholderia sp. ZP32-5]|uniref:YadA family autotransporter adhesin n=1 Tax=Paraburkholderia sp. ZP32-5 TaxID=2883245 RepID=UPI001F30F7D3|nr:YadA-like family protein [Paraburkholderia sp. ZP32-5]
MRRKAVAQAVRNTLGVALAATALHVANVRAAVDSADPVAAGVPGIGATTLGEQATAAGDASLAVGWQANAQSDGATALGAAANAQGEAALALGRDASALSSGASAVGAGANAQGERSSALGLNATALGVDSVAAGSGSMAADNSAAAFGSLSSATTVGATALGYNAQAAGARSLATGAWARASADWGVALGSEATVSGIGGIALGVTAEAAGTRASAIGFGATATGANAIAFGAGANAAADNGVALGANSSTTADLSQPAFAPVGTGATSIAAAIPVGEVSLGSAASERRLTHVAAGAALTDAVNVSQLSAVDGKIDAIAQSSAQHYFKAGGPIDDSNEAVANGTHTLAAGSHANATGTNATAFGTSANANGNGAIALGYGANAAASNAMSLGYNASALAIDSVALGHGSIADRVGTVSVGSIGNERQITNVAAGSADTDAVNVAQLKAVGDLGAATAARLDTAVMYDTNANGSVNRNSVTLGGDPTTGTAIHNVANGVEATDAVNVAQLRVVSDQSAATASKLDAAIMYDTNADGSVNRNSVTLGGDPTTGTAIHNVANAVEATDAVNLGQLTAALDGAISDVVVNSTSPAFSADSDRRTEGAVSSGTHAVAAGANARATGANATAVGTNAVAGGNNATALGATANASADNSVALGQGSLADRVNTVSIGSAGNERQITHVTAGVQGTDAVNVNQLRQSVGTAVDQANHYTDDQIRSARRDGYGGTATALAMAALPQAVLPGRGMIAMAGGMYAGQSALALGVSQLSNTGAWVYKVQGSTDSRGQFGASVGAGMHW